MRRPNLSDVARRAKLAESTISLALNRPVDRCPLSKKTRARAIKAATELGYRASWRAQALATQRTMTLGLLCERGAFYTTGLNERLLNALSTASLEHGYYQMLVPIIEPEARWKELLESDRLDGCIGLSPLSSDLLCALFKLDTPLVLLNLESPLPIPQVLPDDEDGAVQLTRHLLELGHRRIAYLQPDYTDPHFSLPARERGYSETMRNAGCTPQVLSFARNEPALPRLGTNRPTALIAYDHVLALLLLQELWRAGLRVPRDCSVGTFNDLPLLAQTIPPLTTVALPAAEMSRLAVEQLVALIRKEDPGERVRRLPERLVVRASTAAPGSTDG